VAIAEDRMMDHPCPESAPDPFAEAPSRWRGLWSWLPLLVGLIVFEVTADPMLGVALAFLKFGWDDLRAAAWIWRKDESRGRRRASVLFYEAYGLGKMALSSLLVAMAGFVVMATLFFRANPNPIAIVTQQVLGAMIVFTASTLGFVAISGLAILEAWHGRARVWVGPEAYRAYKMGQWPPTSGGVAPRSWANRGRAIVLAFVMLMLWVAIGAAYAIVERPARPLPPLGVTTLNAAFLGSLFAAARVGGKIRRRVLAVSPEDCWPEGATVASSARS
jgi:hypothetical protein